MVRGTHGRGFLLVALIFLFAACEKEIPAGGGKGEKVSILFSINTTSYNTEDNVVRNSGAREAVTTTIPLNDEMYLLATLVPDPDEELRAPVDFEEGQKICFEAYNIASSATPVDSKIYTYTNGKFIPDTDPLGVVPDDGTVFRFVAYSYFGETGVTPAAASIDPVHDLVWGKTAADQTITDTEVSRTVSISMTHKFARVKVKVRSSSISGANIAYLSGVEVEGGKEATLTPFDGSMSYGSAVTQDVGITGSYSTTEVNSAYRTVLPVSPSPIKVKFGGVRVSTNGTTFSNQTAEFSSTLNVGTSYLLYVDLKRLAPFAYSNIVWTGTKLTFATTLAETATIPAASGGVYFKWGSLVALGAMSGDFSSSYTLFSSTGNTYSFGSIPYADETTGTFYNSVEDEDDFATYNGNTGFNATTGKGDICRYITSQGWVSGNWRMPTARDFSYFPTVIGSTGTSSFSSGSNAYGTSANGYYQFTGMQFTVNVFVPYSGRWGEININYPNQAIPLDSGSVGCLWTASSGTTTGVTFSAGEGAFWYRVAHNQSVTDVIPTVRRYNACPVRCVKT
jgi:hypothetical protein